ncbi:MAG: hypothetical protein AAF330_04060 [Pseudomonadota bacterium]
MTECFEDMLRGGHPNSLGRTIDVVDQVLADPARIEELFACYGSDDAVVRLRVSNALRRVQAERPDLVQQLVDRVISEIGALDQASAQWTLPKLFEGASLSPLQTEAALALVKRNLAEHSDWIVLNNSMDYLARLALSTPGLTAWLRPHLERLSADPRTSVAKRATKHLAKMSS